MNLKDLFATVTGLAARLDASAKAEFEQFKASVTTQVEKLQGELTDALAKVTGLEADKTKLANDLSAATGSLANLQTELNAACSALKVELKDGATDKDKVAALQTKVSDTLAKLGTNPNDIPAGANKTQAKTKTRAEFESMSHDERNAFFRAGGKLAV